MRVITHKRLERFWTSHPLAKSPLSEFYKGARGAEWRTFADVRAMFSSADVVGRCVVFNIGGNKFRLIAAIHYQKPTRTGKWSMGRVYIREVLTHAEYDQGNWKDECGAK